MEKWIELTYINAWTGNEEKCIITSAYAEQCACYGLAYAIYHTDSGYHVWLIPMAAKEIGRRELDKEEALKWVSNVDTEEVIENFKQIYGNCKMLDVMDLLELQSK